MVRQLINQSHLFKSIAKEFFEKLNCRLCKYDTDDRYKEMIKHTVYSNANRRTSETVVDQWFGQ